MSDEMHTLKAIADRMGVSQKTVSRIVKDGQMRVVRPSPQVVRVLESEYQRYLASLSRPQSSRRKARS